MKHQNISVIENGIKITLNLGRQGEYNVRDIKFDMSDFQQKYGDGTATIVHYPTNGSAYTVPSISGDSKDSAVLDSENILTWTIGRLATMHDGYGIAEITWLTADGLKKSIRYNTYCKESIGNYGTDRAAQQSYIDQMVELASTITDLSSEFSDAERIAAEISDARENAVSDIETLESNVIGSINNAKSESIEDIGDSKESALDALNTAKQTALSDIESAKQDAETDINAEILIAENHANNASQSATNAQQSATSASNSADSASQSATNASQFADNASNSATSASQFADSASTSANSASQSATSAQASANNASTSEQNARQSAEDAQDILDSVQAEGNTQIGRVQAKGDEIIESLPDDFTQVQNDIATLNGSLGTLEEDSSALVSVTEIDVKTKLTWERGSFSGGTGAESASGTRLRSKEYLDASVYSSLNISIDSGYKYAIYSYDSERNFIPSLSYTGWRTSALTLTLPQNVKFIRFLVADTEDGSASTEYSEKITISGTYKIINNLKNDSPNLNDYVGISLGWEIGSLQPTDGSELSSNSRVRSRKFFVGKGTRLGLTDALTYKHLLYMYSTDGNYISSGNWSNKDIIVEQDAVIRVLLAYSNNETISNVDDFIDKEIVSYSLPYTELLNSKTPAIYDISENKKRKAEISVFKQKKTTSEAYGQCDLKMMFFTDVHGDALRTQRMTDLISNWGASYFDVAVCGGDIVNNIISDDISWYYTATNDLNVPLLNTVGNHDAWLNLNGTLASQTDVYNKIVAPIVAGSGITQPTDAATNGYNYYYKDFNNAVRIIVIDCMYWDATQLTWFESVLSDANTNNLHVLCVSHAAFPLSSMQKVDCLWSKSGVNTDNVRTNLEAAEAVKTYIDNGGIFVAWLVGHQHGDDVHILNSYNNQIVINLASFAQRAGWLLKNTEKTEYNYDCLTYVAIDTTNSIIKLMRIGANIDIYGTQYNGLVVDYSNSNVVSSY